MSDVHLARGSRHRDLLINDCNTTMPATMMMMMMRRRTDSHDAEAAAVAAAAR